MSSNALTPSDKQALKESMSRLEWTDLLIDNISPEQFQQWIAPWRSLLSGHASPAFMTRFGVWFLRRPEGHVEKLDVLTGALSIEASSYEDFVSLVNDRGWQEQNLLSEIVYELHQAGKVAAGAQCYALAPHPAFGSPNPMLGDSVDSAGVMVMDAYVWQSLCAQALGIPNA